jgi:hypothetical protein
MKLGIKEQFMKVLLLLNALWLASCAAGCGQEEPVVLYWDTENKVSAELGEHVSAFLDLAGAAKKVDKLKPVQRILLVNYSLGEDILGVCRIKKAFYMDRDFREIIIWKGATDNPWILRMLVFHELTHCALNIKEHRDEEFGHYMESAPLFHGKYWERVLYQQTMEIMEHL